MNCKLCKKQINNYSEEFNLLKIDNENEIPICSDCVDKFSKWQQEKIAKLFPTKTMKKIAAARK
jgi:hypothetical protein